MVLGPIEGSGGVTIDSGDGIAIGGPLIPLRGYIGRPHSPSTPGLVAGHVPFIVATIEMYRPETEFDFSMGWGAAPWGSLSITAPALEETLTINVSDRGYRTESPVTPYPPYLQSGLTLDARIPLSPSQVGVVWGWGELSIVNVNHLYDAMVASWNAEGRSITIKYGVKLFDDERGIFTDPVYADLETIFVGVASKWLLSEFALNIQLRDASHWLDLPLQRTLYAGTGTYDGDASLAGVPKPKTRGKAYNVPLLLIDQASRIYQYNDGPGSVVALYEGGATGVVGIQFQSDTANLYSGTTNSGFYRTDNSRGLIQLGATPSDNAALTATVIGHFPVAGLKTTAADIARYVLTEDMALPTAYVDAVSFSAAATDYPYEAGWYFGPEDRVSGATAIGRCLAGFGANLSPAASGALQCVVLTTIGDDEVPVKALTVANIKSLTPRAISLDITPAVWRVRCAYQHNYTVQSSGLLGAATDAHRQFVQSADRFAAWSDSAVQLAYATAVDLPSFGGGLTTEADAQAVADRVGAWLGRRRWLFDMNIPLVEGIEVNFGDVVMVDYPLHATTRGARARVVGRGFDTSDLSMTLTVLI